MKPHPLANLFPLTEGDIDALASDIETHGQRQPITLFEGKILDGRRRYRACQRVHIKPIVKAYPGNDPLSYVVSMNLVRRHLNESQRAMIASKIVNVPRGGRRKEPANLPVPRLAQADAARLLKISERSIRTANVIRDVAEPEIQSAVDRGHLTLHLALQASKLSKADQQQVVRHAEAGGNVKAFFNKLLRTKDEARVRTLAPVADKFSTPVIDPPYEHHEPTYATMTPAQLRALDVQQWALANCALYVWTPSGEMQFAFELLARWGFEFKNILTWVKPHFGHGAYFRNSTEHVLFGVRGNVKIRRADIPTHFEAPDHHT